MSSASALPHLQAASSSANAETAADKDPPANPGIETAWKEREAYIIGGITRVADENFRTSFLYKRWHLSCSVVLLVCAVLAPLSVASTSSGSPLESISRSFPFYFSLFLTVSIGFVEGLRRIFRFEQRWFAYYSAGTALVQARERYLDITLELRPGSEAWKTLFFSLHKEVQSIFNEQAKVFFQGVIEQNELPTAGNNKPPRRAQFK